MNDDDTVLHRMAVLRREHPDGDYPAIEHDRGECTECDAIRRLMEEEDDQADEQTNRWAAFTDDELEDLLNTIELDYWGQFHEVWEAEIKAEQQRRRDGDPTPELGASEPSR